LPSRASSLWTRPDSPQRTSFARRLSHKPWSLVPTHNGCQSRCVRSAANGFRPPRASDLPRRGEAPLVLDHKQFPVRQVCATATAGSAPLPDDRFHVSRRRGPRDRNGDGAREQARRPTQSRGCLCPTPATRPPVARLLVCCLQDRPAWLTLGHAELVAQRPRMSCALSARCGAELVARDALVATTKQDCIGSSRLSEHGQIAVEVLPRYAYSGRHARAAAYHRRAVARGSKLGSSAPASGHTSASRGSNSPGRCCPSSSQARG
jgi:hypothetical protein